MKNLVFLVGIFAIVTAMTSPLSGQPANILDRRFTDVNLKNVTVNEVLLQALVNTDTPGGIVVSAPCGVLPRHSYTPTEPSLRGLLNTLVLAEPAYTWALREGVVNMFPREMTTPFLMTVIPRLEIKAATPSEALEQLLKTRGVSEQARRDLGSRLVQGGVYSSIAKSSGPKSNTLSMKATNISVLEALNRIARTHGKAVWVLSQSRCNARDVYSIDFIAR